MPHEDVLTAPRLQQLIECEEIPAKEIYIFGGYAFTEKAQRLKQMGVNVEPSIRKGVTILSDKMQADLGKKSQKAATT